MEIISQSRPDESFSGNGYKEYTMSMKSQAGRVMESVSKELQPSKGVYNV